MSNTRYVNEQPLADEPADEPLVCSPVTAVEQLLRLQSDIEGQGKPVALAITPIVEALDYGSNVSHEMLHHLEAHILRAHLQLDELEEFLDTLASCLREGASTPLASIAVLQEPAQPARR